MDTSVKVRDRVVKLTGDGTILEVRSVDIAVTTKRHSWTT